MSECCVVVSDASRARFFTLEPSGYPGVRSGLRLVEHDGLHNPDCSARDADGFSDIRSGVNRTVGSSSHTYDDHRSRHIEEFTRRFAGTVAEHARQLSDARCAPRIILVAADRMLGHLRRAFGSAGTVVDQERALDLTKQSTQQIHQRLARDGLLPPAAPSERKPA